MVLITIFIILAALGVIWHIIATILIYEALRQRNMEVSFIFLRFMSPIYAHRYKLVTREESGRTGLLFYQWIISINMALVAVIISVIVSIV